MILYEMLTANLPFEGPNVYAVMKAKAAEDPRPPSRWVADLDPKLEEIVLHAIERSPRNRYNDAKELLADLEDPSRVVVTGRAHHLHPPASWQRFRAVIMAGVFFVSLIAIFVAARLAGAPLPGRAGAHPGRLPRSGAVIPSRHRLMGTIAAATLLTATGASAASPRGRASSNRSIWPGCWWPDSW